MPEQLLFLDTETTGKGPDDRLIQLAYSHCLIDDAGEFSFRFSDAKNGVNTESKVLNPVIYSNLFCPPVKISFDAMAIHSITPELVEGKMQFNESPYWDFLRELSNTDVLIAHNAPFDLAIMDREGVRFHRWIDTCRVARHLIDQPNYQLQYLRYALGLYKALPEALPSHDASADVAVLCLLFKYLFEWHRANNPNLTTEEIIRGFIELSRLPVELKAFGFGKYAGQTFEYVARLDVNYLKWLYNSESAKGDSEQNKDLLHTLILWLSKKNT